MANTLRFKRGLASGIPTAVAGEPLFTTDTFDLYIGNGTTNTRFQKYIASGTTSQLLRGDGSLLTMPIVLTSPSNGQVLKFNGTSWVNDSDSGITGSGAAGQVAYFTGATTQAGSNNLFWDNTNVRLGIGTNAPTTTLDIQRSGLNILKLNGGTGTNQGSSLYIQNGNFCIGDAASFLGGTPNTNFGIYTSSFPLIFYVGSTSERARFHATGNFGINTGATDSGQRLQVIGTSYFSDSVGIGATSLTGYTIRIGRTMTGSTSVFGIGNYGVIQSGVTSVAAYYDSYASTQSANFGLTDIRHYNVSSSGTFANVTAGGSVTNQYGFYVDSTITGATNNYGFFGNIAAATGRWNLYMNGTANNYMAGSLGIGSTTLTGINLRLSKTITGATSSYGILNDGVIQPDVTSIAAYNRVVMSKAAGVATSIVVGYWAVQGTYSGTVDTQYGYLVDSTLTGATNNYAYFSNIASGTGRWNLYMNGTALNYLNGSLLIGSTTDSGEKLQVTGTMKVTGATTIGGNLTVDTNVLFVDATNNRVGVLTTTPASAFQIGGTAGNTGVLQYTITSASPVSNQLLFGTDGTGYQFAIGKNQGGTISNLVFLQDNGNLGVGISPAYRLDVSGSARVSDAIAIGTTPDTNNPFKILKNLNTTVGIKFENTNTSSLSFSAVQLGNDITGGTAFTNLVYGSSGITESGVYKPSGTALINTGSGGLNFLAVSQPIRFFTSTGNGTERVRIKNEGHVRFVPLSAAPTTNVEAGDVYYDSTTNKLRCYNGTSWNDLF